MVFVQRWTKVLDEKSSTFETVVTLSKHRTTIQLALFQSTKPPEFDRALSQRCGK